MAKKWDSSPIEVTLDYIKESMNKANTAQEVGEFPPEKGYKAWGIKCNGESNKWYTLFANEKPEVGSVLSIRRFVTVAEGSTEEKYPKWMLESDYKKISSAPRGGGFGGGAKPNYSLEQEAYRDGQAAAIRALQGGVLGKDGNQMPFTYANIKQLASFLAKDIVDAGKKSEA